MFCTDCEKKVSVTPEGECPNCLGYSLVAKAPKKKKASEKKETPPAKTEETPLTPEEKGEEASS